MLAVRIPEELNIRLSALSRKTGRTKSFFAREALLDQIDALEKKYLINYRYDSDEE